MQSHHLAGFLYLPCELVILLAWLQVSARMIVCKGNYCGVYLQCFADDNAYIDCCFGDSAVGKTMRFQMFEVLIHQHYVCFLHVKVAHSWQ